MELKALDASNFRSTIFVNRSRWVCITIATLVVPLDDPLAICVAPKCRMICGFLRLMRKRPAIRRRVCPTEIGRWPEGFFFIIINRQPRKIVAHLGDSWPVAILYIIVATFREEISIWLCFGCPRGPPSIYIIIHNSLYIYLIMRIFLHQKVKIIDVPLSILPSWGRIDTQSMID